MKLSEGSITCRRSHEQERTLRGKIKLDAGRTPKMFKVGEEIRSAQMCLRETESNGDRKWVRIE